MNNGNMCIIWIHVLIFLDSSTQWSEWRNNRNENYIGCKSQMPMVGSIHHTHFPIFLFSYFKMNRWKMSWHAIPVHAKFTSQWFQMGEKKNHTHIQSSSVFWMRFRLPLPISLSLSLSFRSFVRELDSMTSVSKS